MSAQGGKVSLLQRIENFPAADAKSRKMPSPLQPPPPVTTIRRGMDEVAVRKGFATLTSIAGEQTGISHSLKSSLSSEPSPK